MATAAQDKALIRGKREASVKAAGSRGSIAFGGDPRQVLDAFNESLRPPAAGSTDKDP